MLWLNLNVFFYLKLNSVFFYRSLIVNYYFKFWNNLFIYLYNCFITSRLTTFILFYFFIIVLFTNESLVLFLLNFNNIFDIINSSNWTNSINFLLTNTYIYSSWSVYAISYVIIFICLFTLRFFFILKNYNMF